MEAKQRREEILRLLNMDMKPLSATRLADHFGVSRQIVVGDVALLRAAGECITATSRGYVLGKAPGIEEKADTYVLTCSHDKSALETELYTVLDNGGSFLNISIEHKLYGTIVCDMNITSRYEADVYLKQIALDSAPLLSDLTGGVHFHTIHCPSSDVYRRVLSALKDKGLLYSQR